MSWPMRSAFDAGRRQPKNPKPKAGPDLCADCAHERRYHNAIGCGIEQCGCQEFTRTPSMGRVREVAAAFREGYVAGYERGESGDAEDKEAAWDRSRASSGLLRSDDEHCACLHDGRGELTNECQEHQEIRAERDRLREALQALRIDANRLRDRQLGGTYEEDCRRSIAHADQALNRSEPIDNAQPDRLEPIGRCTGRYPVPQQRDEPFKVTYRCALPEGHDGPHGAEAQP